MANYQTALDLKNAVLSICGELTDGSSGYDSDALTYLNLAYKGVLSGGNIYGIDVADPWSWALAKRPIVITLQPAIQSVAATTTQYSNNITFDSTPLDPTGAPISVAGWWINFNNRDEWFRIVQHAVGGLSAQIDVGYTEQALISASTVMVKLDYDLVDDSILIDQYNAVIDFSEVSGGALVATLTQGIYSPVAFANMAAAAMQAAGTQTYSGSWSKLTRLFTWTSSNTFNLLNASGVNTSVNASAEMGLDMLDYTGATSYQAAYPLNAIQRLTAPAVCYRQTSYYPLNGWSSPKDEGKIFELSFNAFVREYPLRYMRSMVPNRFCVTESSDTGIVSVRFNTYLFDNPTKVEMNYIPIQRNLQANDSSLPVLPEAHRKYLVDAAAGMLLHDKSDNRRTEREQLAKAGLQALQHTNRKDLSLAGNNYGKLIPRVGNAQNRRWIIA
jgi:hypothetical protein